jgi:hypothetical protein
MAQRKSQPVVPLETIDELMKAIKGAWESITPE